MATTNANLIIQFAKTRLQLAFAEILKEATAEQITLAGKRFEGLVDAFTKDALSPQTRKTVNQGLAIGMHEEMLRAYETNVLGYKVAPSYRTEDRYSGGRLLHALEDPSNAVGTADGIGYINEGLLNSRAKQWARLNFGASPGEGFSGPTTTGTSTRLRFGKNQSSIPLHLGGGMSPGFRVPAKGFGHFENGAFFMGAAGKRGRTTGRFRGAGERSPIISSRPSRGIRPRHYLDAGLVYLSENFSAEWSNAIQDKFREAMARGNNRA